jgi:16S rRNA (uracil1498-N3)-methyltransferase
VNLFYQPEIPAGVHHLDEDESRHAVKVLRMQMGDLLHITDGKGNSYQAVIASADTRKCTFTIQQTTSILARPFSIAIAVAPTKNIDRIEWLVEKVVEIGVEEIHFMRCKTQSVKLLTTNAYLKLPLVL